MNSPVVFDRTDRPWPGPGEYKITERAGGEEVVWLRCPTCHGLGTLTDHEVDAEGRVEPSVVCPEGNCHFHEMITLSNWQGGEDEDPE